MDVPSVRELLGEELYDRVKSLRGLTVLQVDLPTDIVEPMFKELKKAKLTFDNASNNCRWYVLSLVESEKEGTFWMTAVPMGKIH